MDLKDTLHKVGDALNPFDNIDEAIKNFVHEKNEELERRVKVAMLRLDAKYHKFRYDEAVALADKIESGGSEQG